MGGFIATPVSGAPLSPTLYQQFYESNPVRIEIVLNGGNYSAQEVTYTENGHGATDTATIIIPLSSNPDFTVELFRGDYFGYFDAPNGVTVYSPQNAPGSSYAFSDNSPVYVQIHAGFPQNPALGSSRISQLPIQFTGIVDLYSAVFENDTVTFTCRSLGAPLVDDTLMTTSMNQTMAQFIAQMSKKYGLPAPIINLSPGFIPATIQEVLAYDQIGGSNFAASLYGMHPMDLMIRGAQVDDADVWVDVRTGAIHYESPDTFETTRAIVDMQYGRDWMGLSASHAPQFSKNVEVQVHTHQPRTKTSTTVRVQNDASGNITVATSSRFTTSDVVLGTNQTIAQVTATSPTGVVSNSTTYSTVSGGNITAKAQQGAGETGKQKYPLYVGNVSPARAATIAKAYWRHISQHEFAIEGEVPMTLRWLSTLSITALIRISGAPWSLVNNTYYPRKLEHHISVEEGWKIKVSALNHRLASGAV